DGVVSFVSSAQAGRAQPIYLPSSPLTALTAEPLSMPKVLSTPLSKSVCSPLSPPLPSSVVACCASAPMSPVCNAPSTPEILAGSNPCLSAHALTSCLLCSSNAAAPGMLCTASPRPASDDN